jgi:hypothetical protein
MVKTSRRAFLRTLQFAACGVLLIGGMSLVTRAAPDASTNRVLMPGTERPANAIVLFDGSNTDQWIQYGSNRPCTWKLIPVEKAMVEGGGDIATKKKFGAYQLHLEWKEPMPKPDQHGQDRGNSGVYQQSRYELQVLDSYHNDTYANGACGAVYAQTPPAKNVCKPPGEWQAYDITLWPAQFKDGKKVKDAFITVYQNGELIQDHTDIKKSTPGGIPRIGRSRSDSPAGPWPSGGIS